MESLLRWSYVPWVYSVRVTVFQALLFAVQEIAGAVSKGSADLEGFDRGFNLNSDAHIQIRGLLPDDEHQDDSFQIDILYKP